MKRELVLEAIIVLAIYFLALGIRALPSDRFPNIYGFDSFWAARQAKHIIEGGWFPYNDSITDYPFGRITRGIELGWWMWNVLWYKALGGGLPFNYDLFGKIASWSNAILGSLAVVGLYLFGRYGFNSKWAGIIFALSLALLPPHLYYSMYGHAENDATGLSLFFLALGFFMAFIKTRKWVFGIFLWATLTWLSMVWRSYMVFGLLIPAVTLIYVVVAFILSRFKWYEWEGRKKERENLMFSLIILLFTTPFYLILPISTWGSVVGFFSAITLLVLIGLEKFEEGVWRISKKEMLFILIALTFIGLAFTTANPVKSALRFLGFSGKGNVPDYTQRLWQTIAEQNPVPGQNIIDRINHLSLTGFGLFIWLATFGIIYGALKVVLGSLWKGKWGWYTDLLITGFVGFTLWRLTTKSQNIFFLSGVVAVGAAYFLWEAGKWIKKWKIPYHNLWFPALIIFLLSANFLGIYSNAKSVSYDVYPEWRETFHWINKNVENGAVLTAWWDYGHWLNYFCGDKTRVTIDNIQDKPKLIYMVASAFTHTPKCQYDYQTKQFFCDASPEALQRAEDESVCLLKALKTNYVIIDKEIVGGVTGGKFGALEHIANSQIGCFQTVRCVKVSELEQVQCLLGYQNGQPIGISFSEKEWEQLKNVTWPGEDLSYKGIPTRAFARDDSSGPTLYMSAISCGSPFIPSANAPVLYSFEHRLFFKDPSLRRVKLVYENPWIVIYKVISYPENCSSEWVKERDLIGG